MTNSAKPPKDRPSYEPIVAELERRIRASYYGEGDRIMESDIRRDFGASRDAVRQAIAFLLGAGQLRNGETGIFVREHLKHDLDANLACLTGIFSFAAQRASQSPQARTKIMAAYQEARTARTFDPDALAALFERFYLLIFSEGLGPPGLEVAAALGDGLIFRRAASNLRHWDLDAALPKLVTTIANGHEEGANKAAQSFMRNLAV